MNNVSFYKLTGKGYERGWWTNFKGRYRCFKGARNTKKSYVMIGLEVLDKILSDNRRNILILRNTLNTQRYSTFSTILMLIHNLDPSSSIPIDISNYFKVNNSDLSITYIPTGQVILFRGMDDPQKIQSIRVVKGYLTDVYVEEAFEFEDFEAWRKIDGSIRANKFFDEDLFIQITFCFNAWNKKHWLYEHFFKGRLEDDFEYLETHSYMDYRNEDEVIDFGKGLYLHIGSYKINEFRDLGYDVAMEELKKKALDIYKVEALGMWGNSTGATYPHFREELIIPKDKVFYYKYSFLSIGIDTGLSNGEGKVKYDEKRFKSATTMQLAGLDSTFDNLICIDEYFYSNQNQLIPKTSPELMEDMILTIIRWSNEYSILFGNRPILVYVDCADIGFRQGLETKAKEYNLYAKFIPSTKMKIQTRVDYINLIMAYGNFLVSEKCNNLIREIENSHIGEKGEPREDYDDHSINANEYAWASFINFMKRWKTFKPH